MTTARDLKPGMFIKYNGQLHQVVEAQFYKPTKGGSIIRAKLKNVLTGIVTPDTLKSEETMEAAFVEQKELQYLYRDSHGYCFMDNENYEQIYIPDNKLGETIEYLMENMTVIANFCDGEIIFVTPPIHVVLEVIETEPGFKGNTVSGATKPATLETGKVVKVPLFVEVGNRIKVDTRTGEYIERA